MVHLVKPQLYKSHHVSWYEPFLDPTDFYHMHYLLLSRDEEKFLT